MWLAPCSPLCTGSNPCALVVPVLDELAGVEMRATIAFVVDALAVEHLRAPWAVQLGMRVKVTI